MSNSASEVLSVREKLGYSLGDLAANLIFQTLITYLAFFYTDVYRLPPATAATIIFIVGLLGAFVFTPLIGILADRFGKRDVFGGALFVSTLFLLAFLWFPPTTIGLVFVSFMLHGFSYGITIPLLWAMIADVADYSEWKNRRRATAIIFSAMLCGLKIGLSVGGALVAGILAHYGYQAGAASQSADAVEGIRMTVSLYCSLPFLVAVGLLFFYKINKPMEERIERELGERRLQSGASA